MQKKTRKTRTRIDFQASDSGVGSHSPSPDLASDGEEGPRNKRYDAFYNSDGFHDEDNHKDDDNSEDFDALASDGEEM